MKTPVLLLAIFTQLTAWAIHQEINYSGLSSDSATTLSTCISKGRVFGAINFNYSYSTNCDTFYYESFGNLALCKYNKAMLIEKVQVIQNFFVNRRIFNVDMVATDQHIYLLGSAHGPIIAANDTFTVTNSAPIVLKINANSMKVEAVSELKNDFGNCQLKLLENNNNLYVVAMSPQPFNCAPYFNQKKQLILLKANTSFVFVPAFAKEFKRNPNFLDEMTFKKNMRIGAFASVNYNGNAIAGYQLSDTGFTQIVGYPLSDGLQVGDVAFTAAHDLYFTFAEDRNKVLNIKDLYQSSYDSTTYNLLLVKISADKKVTIAKWQSSTRQTLFGDLEANDSTVVFCTELSGKLSNGNQQLDASNLTKSEHAFYAFATYNTQLELQHLTPFQIEGKHIHPEVIEIENSHSFIVSGYAIQNIGPCNSVGVNNIREMWFASQLQYIIDTSRGDTTLIPNAFTPNADGLNDEWKIISSEFDSFTVLIFSKSGCIVYAQNAQHISWSGYRKGELLPTDHYFYLVNAFGSSGNRKFTGLVHLIR